MDDLQRFIATQLGWRELEMSSYWDESYDDVSQVHCLFGTSPTGNYRPLPAWTTSVDVALTLPLPDKVGFYLMYAAAAICEAWKTLINKTPIL